MRYLWAVAVVVVMAGCSATSEEPVLEPLEAEGITTEILWERITEESDYTSYAYWPGHEGERPGQAPHGVLHRIHVNRTLLEALPAADKRAPAGSIIVKDSLDASGNLINITVMAKVDGYSPENGDWYWAMYGPDGMARAGGELNGCITCHEGLKSNDYVIVRQLDAE